jgi:hypothetical protein
MVPSGDNAKTSLSWSRLIRARLKAIGLNAPFLSLAFLLLILLSGYVIGLMPVKTPEQLQHWVEGHQATRNFIIAEKLISPLLPAPSSGWSTTIHCKNLGHGVAFAQGVVITKSFWGLEVPTTWQAVFYPDDAKPLFLAVGTHEVGNWSDALKAAGINPEQH